MTGPIPESWLPEAKVDRLICHWTGGNYDASLLERLQYHLLIQGDGKIVRGFCPIGRGSPHTRRLNAGSVGIALCGMAGAVEQPLDWGRTPLSPFQMSRLVAVLTQLVDRYGLPISPRTLLSHAEVPEVYGLPQHGPWDLRVWPQRPELRGAAAVGSELRRRVRERCDEQERRAAEQRRRRETASFTAR